MPEPKTKKARATRERIVNEAVQLFSVKGYFHTTLDDVMAKVRLTKGGFYAHFDSKEALARAVVEHATQMWTHKVMAFVSSVKDPRDQLRALIEGHGFVLNPANKQAVMEVMTKKLAINDPVAANDGYEDYVRRTDKRAFVVLDGLKNIQRFMKERNPKIGDIALDRLVDDRIMREFEKSGFLDQALGSKSAAH